MSAPEFVEWLDSAGPHGWVAYDPTSSKPAMTCWSVGYVVAETEAEIVLSGSLGFDGAEISCVHSPLSIPKLAIVRRQALVVDRGSLAAANSGRLVRPPGVAP